MTRTDPTVTAQNDAAFAEWSQSGCPMGDYGDWLAVHHPDLFDAVCAMEQSA